MANSSSKVKEQRKAARRPASMVGQILDPAIGIVADCRVRDYSGLGARLQLLQPVKVPAVFWLKLKGDGTLRYCNVKWREMAQIGVEFTRDELLKVAENEVQQLRHQLSWAGAGNETI